jgi:hypothetical protein
LLAKAILGHLIAAAAVTRLLGASANFSLSAD